VDHPRGEHGRFIPAGGAEAVSTAREKVAAALKEPPTSDGLRKLTEHLSILTVKQLYALKAEHGLKASGATKEQLKAKLADRLHRGRREPGEEPKVTSDSAVTRMTPDEASAALQDLRSNPPKVRLPLMVADDRTGQGGYLARVGGLGSGRFQLKFVDGQRVDRSNKKYEIGAGVYQMKSGGNAHWFLALPSFDGSGEPKRVNVKEDALKKAIETVGPHFIDALVSQFHRDSEKAGRWVSLVATAQKVRTLASARDSRA
jgi:hypothetical protein